MIVSAAALAVASSASCLDPTQITLTVSTDLRCDVTKGTAFTGGQDALAIEAAPPTGTTQRCVAGGVGTLVASSGEKDGRAVFVVTMGVDVPVSECTAAKSWKGCIVQRRSLRYVKHTPLTLPIAMLLVCKDKVCDANSTCARSGKCVPSEIKNAESCADADCYPEGDSPPPKPGEDGGSDGADPSDGSGGDGNPTEGGPADSGTETGPSETGTDGALPPEGRLYCPPEVLGCPRGDTCCWDKRGDQGACGGGALCPPRNQIPLRCNQKADCLIDQHCCGTVVNTDDGMGNLRRDVLSSDCRQTVGAACLGPRLCLQNSDCPTGACDKNTALFQPPGIFGECVP